MPDFAMAVPYTSISSKTLTACLRICLPESALAIIIAPNLADSNDQPAYAQYDFQQLQHDVGSKELHIGDTQHPRHKGDYTQRNKHDTLDSNHGTTSFTSRLSQIRLCITWPRVFAQSQLYRFFAQKLELIT